MIVLRLSGVPPFLVTWELQVLGFLHFSANGA